MRICFARFEDAVLPVVMPRLQPFVWRRFTSRIGRPSDESREAHLSTSLHISRLRSGRDDDWVSKKRRAAQIELYNRRADPIIREADGDET